MMKILKYVVRGGKRIYPATGAGFGDWDSKWTDGKDPHYDYQSPVWSGPFKHMRCDRQAKHTLRVPRTHEVIEIGLVTTILPYRSKGVTRCYTLTPSRGLSMKLTPCFVDTKSGLHGKTERSLRAAIKRHRLANIRAWAWYRFKKLTTAEVEAKLRSNTRRVTLSMASASVGNCAAGTKSFCGDIGLDPSRKARAGAVYRLAKMKGLHNNTYFRRAALAALY